MERYVHPELNHPWEFFSGTYVFIEEGRLTCLGKEVLFFIGLAEVQASCCGRGGGGFIKIPGFLQSWKFESAEDGRPVSGIERISDEGCRNEIRSVLRERFPAITQIEFL
jgi:hypothetical protein